MTWHPLAAELGEQLAHELRENARLRETVEVLKQKLAEVMGLCPGCRKRPRVPRCAYCKRCRANATALWRKRHPEQVAAYNASRRKRKP